MADAASSNSTDRKDIVWRCRRMMSVGCSSLQVCQLEAMDTDLVRHGIYRVGYGRNQENKPRPLSLGECLLFVQHGTRLTSASDSKP